MWIQTKRNRSKRRRMGQENSRHQEDVTGIVAATRSGDLEKIKQLLADNPDVLWEDMRGDRGNSVLQLAILLGFNDLALEFIGLGRSWPSNNQGAYPVHTAAEVGNVEILRLLLANMDEKQAEHQLNARTVHGSTPLRLSVEHEACFLMLSDVFAQQDFELKDAIGDSVLTTLVTKNKISLLKAYLQRKPEIDHADVETGETAVVVATQMGHEECLKLLLEAGADANMVTNDGYHPLHLALQRLEYGCFRILLEHGKEITPVVSTVSGDLPMHLLLKSWNTEDDVDMSLVETLISMEVLDVTPRKTYTEGKNQKVYCWSLLRKNQSNETPISLSHSFPSIKKIFLDHLPQGYEDINLLRIQVTSDIHLEFGPADELLKPSAPYLALLGDIGLVCANEKQTKQYEELIDNTAAKFKKVFVLAGNHEYYHGDLDEVNNVIRSICEKYENVVFLQRNSFEIEGVRIIGSTLWTYIPEKSRQYLQYAMNDYNCIKTKDEEQVAISLSPEHTIKLHEEDVAYFKEEIKKAADANQHVIAMSHHAPITKFGFIQPKDAPIKSANGTDLMHLMGDNVKAWLYGHTHMFHDGVHSGTRIVTNPHGYTTETLAYRNDYVVEIPLYKQP